MTPGTCNLRRALRVLAWSTLAVVLTACAEVSGDGPAVAVFKSPDCGCCAEWVSYLRDHGFNVTVHNMNDMAQVKARYGVPGQMQTCHTATVEGYVVEGHVPVEAIRRLLSEKPRLEGIAVPGMPATAPGMGASNGNSFDVYSFDNSGRARFYARG